MKDYKGIVLRIIKNRYLLFLFFINTLIMFIPFYLEIGYENEMRNIIIYYNEVSAFDFIFESIEFNLFQFLFELLLFFFPSILIVIWFKFQSNKIVRGLSFVFTFFFGAFMFWFGNHILESRFESAFDSSAMSSSYVFFISWFLILLLPLLFLKRIRSSWSNPATSESLLE